MIGIQLYTVADKIRDIRSAEAVIKALKDIGYECVQLAGNIETVEMTALACKNVEMSVIGFLVDIDTCETEQARLFAAAKLCGATDIGISAILSNEAETEALIQRANAFSKIAKENHFTFSYHNHSLEFIRCENGKTVMELICEGLDGDLMPDTYWIQHGGADVRDFIEKHKDKIKILHLKDMKRAATGPTFSELGLGNMNIEGIVKTATECGIHQFIVEQDVCERDPLDSARISFAYLKNLQL